MNLKTPLFGLRERQAPICINKNFVNSTHRGGINLGEFLANQRQVNQMIVSDKRLKMC